MIGIDVAGGDTRNRMVPGGPVAPYTYGYNSPLIVQRVRDVLAALRFAKSGGLPPKESVTLTAQSPTEAADQRGTLTVRRPPALRLRRTPRTSLGFGKDAGVWASRTRGGTRSRRSRCDRHRRLPLFDRHGNRRRGDAAPER